MWAAEAQQCASRCAFAQIAARVASFEFRPEGEMLAARRCPHILQFTENDGNETRLLAGTGVPLSDGPVGW